MTKSNTCQNAITAAGLPVLWLNNSVGFGMDDSFYYDIPGAELISGSAGDTKTFTLRIYEAQLTDEGTYECQVPGAFPVTQAHTVTINSKFHSQVPGLY